MLVDPLTKMRLTASGNIVHLNNNEKDTESTNSIDLYERYRAWFALLKNLLLGIFISKFVY